MYRVGIVTLSDKGASGQREDTSGPLIKDLLPKDQYEVIRYVLLPDDKEELKKELIDMADHLKLDLVLTTGGTGFSPRDITPEATREVADRLAEGIAQAIRNYSMSITKRAMLSRATSVIRKNTLIINMPGSPKAVREELEFILDTLSHGLEVLQGNVNDCARK